MNTLAINGQDITIKEYQGQRVVTFKEIDAVHGRNDGTARKRFYDNRKHFMEGTDYFRVGSSEIRTNKIPGIPSATHRDIYLITETGYLMLVKSFTDDLAWKVQRELVKNYFNSRSEANTGRKAPEKKAVCEILNKISRRNIAIEVLGELYEWLSKPEYREPLCRSMEIISFDICSKISDLKMPEHK